MNRLKRKQRTSLFIKAALFCFALYAAVTLVRLQLNIVEKKQQLDTLHVQVEDLTTMNQELHERLDKSTSDESISQAARKDGYIVPGERVFVDTTSK